MKTGVDAAEVSITNGFVASGTYCNDVTGLFRVYENKYKLAAGSRPVIVNVIPVESSVTVQANEVNPGLSSRKGAPAAHPAPAVGIAKL